MAYVIYNLETSKIVQATYLGRSWYETQSAARAAVTRAVKRGRISGDRVGIASATDYFANIEQTEVVINLMSGLQVTQSVNTPIGCDPSSESYWSN